MVYQGDMGVLPWIDVAQRERRNALRVQWGDFWRHRRVGYGAEVTGLEKNIFRNQREKEAECRKTACLLYLPSDPNRDKQRGVQVAVIVVTRLGFFWLTVRKGKVLAMLQKRRSWSGASI